MEIKFEINEKIVCVKEVDNMSLIKEGNIYTVANIIYFPENHIQIYEAPFSKFNCNRFMKLTDYRKLKIEKIRSKL